VEVYAKPEPRKFNHSNQSNEVPSRNHVRQARRAARPRLWLAQFSYCSRGKFRVRPVPTNTGSEELSRAPQTYTHEGVSIEFSIEPLSSTRGTTAKGTTGNRRPTELLAGTEATVRFKIFDTTGGKPLGNLRPVAWIDQRAAGKSSGCQRLS